MLQWRRWCGVALGKGSQIYVYVFDSREIAKEREREKQASDHYPQLRRKFKGLCLDEWSNYCSSSSSLESLKLSSTRSDLKMNSKAREWTRFLSNASTTKASVRAIFVEANRVRVCVCFFREREREREREKEKEKEMSSNKKWNKTEAENGLR